MDTRKTYRWKGTEWSKTFGTDKSPPEKWQFLAVIDAEIVLCTKTIAIERDAAASAIVQQAMADFLRHEAVTLIQQST
jgi:hypothetical protein